MSKTAIRVTPFGGYDIPGLEKWLADMAAGGLQYFSTAGPLSLFTKTESQTVQVHLEPIRGAVEDDPDLNALYAEDDWQYWGMFRGNYYVYAATAPRGPAHTDPETQAYALKKFLRQKIYIGVLLLFANAMVLSVYEPWNISPTDLRYFPVTTFSNGLLSATLALLGIALIDLSYLIGLIQLTCYRKAVKAGTAPRTHRGVGWLSVVGTVCLLLVAIHVAQLLSSIPNDSYPLEGSNFVTLEQIDPEAGDMNLDPFYSMDYISHSGTVLYPERWYYRQYGRFISDDPNDVPRLEISAVRYPLSIFTKLRAEEMTRIRYSGADYETLSPVHGLDEIYYAHYDGGTYNNGEEYLPGGVLILRDGNTVLHVDYHGTQDLTDHLEAFATLLAGL